MAPPKNLIPCVSKLYITDELQKWDQVKRLEPQVFINPRFTCVLTFQEMAIQRLYSLIFQHHKNIKIIPCFESCNFGNFCFHFKTIKGKSWVFLAYVMVDRVFVGGTTARVPSQGYPSFTGNASLLAQLLICRGDPDALGANGETVRDTRRFWKKNGANLKKKIKSLTSGVVAAGILLNNLIYSVLY